MSEPLFDIPIDHEYINAGLHLNIPPINELIHEVDNELIEAAEDEIPQQIGQIQVEGGEILQQIEQIQVPLQQIEQIQVEGGEILQQIEQIQVPQIQVPEGGEIPQQIEVPSHGRIDIQLQDEQGLLTGDVVKRSTRIPVAPRVFPVDDWYFEPRQKKKGVKIPSKVQTRGQGKKKAAAQPDIRPEIPDIRPEIPRAAQPDIRPEIPDIRPEIPRAAQAQATAQPEISDTISTEKLLQQLNQAQTMSMLKMAYDTNPDIKATVNKIALQKLKTIRIHRIPLDVTAEMIKGRLHFFGQIEEVAIYHGLADKEEREGHIRFSEVSSAETFSSELINGINGTQRKLFHYNNDWGI